jgi:predicted ATPase
VRLISLIKRLLLPRERGELLLLAGTEDADNQADTEFRVAMETANNQGAKLPELRARLACARFHVARDRKQQARDMLVPIYASFCEGLETRDLVEARALLAELQ